MTWNEYLEQIIDQMKLDFMTGNDFNICFVNVDIVSAMPECGSYYLKLKQAVQTITQEDYYYVFQYPEKLSKDMDAERYLQPRIDFLNSLKEEQNANKENEIEYFNMQFRREDMKFLLHGLYLIITERIYDDNGIKKVKHLKEGIQEFFYLDDNANALPK